jgi:transposase-like protein
MAEHEAREHDGAPADEGAELIRRVRELRFGDGARCIRCGSADVGRWGWQHGRQRYRCQTCHRTFSDMSGTPAAYTKRIELWSQHLRGMGEGQTAIGAARNLGVSAETVRRWQQRTLDALAPDQPAVGEGPVVVVRWGRLDGPRFMVAIDAHDAVFETILPYLSSPAAWDAVVRRFLRPGTTVLCNDSPRSPFARAVVRAGLEYVRVGPTGTEGRNDSRARQYARAVRRWLARFRGAEEDEWYRYHVWHVTLHHAGSPAAFVERCLDSWAPP